jgi:hypothetical protein
MSGADMSKNLGGMLSQTAGALGTMGSSYSDSLTRNIENITRPDADPTDIASQQSLMQWQNNMGRVDEGRLTAANIAQMESRRKEEKKAEAIAEVAKITEAMRNIVQAPHLTEEQKSSATSRLQAALTELSPTVGKDLSGTLTALQAQEFQMTQAQVSAEREQARFNWQQASQQEQELDKKSSIEFYKLPLDERETRIAALREQGSIGLAEKLETRYRQDVQWEEARVQAREKAATEALPAMTPTEREILDADLAALKAMNPKLGEQWEKKIDSIESDGILSNQIKRSEIGKQRNALAQFIVNQESAGMASARRLAADGMKEENLTPAPQGLWKDSAGARSPAMEAVLKVKEMTLADWMGLIPFNDSEAEEATQQARAWINEVGPQDAARLAATLVHNRPEMTFEQAIMWAASNNFGVGKDGAPSNVPSNVPSGGAGTTDENRIKL